MVSALALLRAGLAPGDTVECAPAVTVNGKRFENYDDYPSSGLGRIRFADAFANSCNTAFISSRDELGERGLGQAAVALGLGVDHDLGFPAYFGQVPPPEGETEKAADMIGQGKVLASPMAMAAVLASVMHGSTVVPLLLPDHTAEADPDQPLTRQEARQLRDLLRAVVERGSGTALQSLGPDTLAKTGTAEFGTEQPPQTHAWMVGGTDDLAVAVFVEVGESGSGTAGPILKSFLERAGR
jgi:cell division protein FtsI/penicillin-binding protein 2